MAVRWLTMFIDRAEAGSNEAFEFWRRATGTTFSPTRGERGQFATLLPASGDAHVRVQRIDDGPGGTHLDVHSDDPPAEVERAVALGATVAREFDDVTVLRSPGGYPWCVVGWDGEATASAPHAGSSGATSRLDQICLDTSGTHFEAEVGFWSSLLEWSAAFSTVKPEFASLERADGFPMRLLLQRVGGDGPTTGHLDLAAGEQVDEVVADHVALGAVVEKQDWLWTVLVDPSGHRYCVTCRDPVAGVITHLPPQPG